MRTGVETLIPRRRLARRVREMAAEIVADGVSERGLSIVCVMDGAFMFCADLVRQLEVPLRLAFVPVVSVDRGEDPARVDLPPRLPLRGADLLIVEDILDSGRTLAALASRLAGTGPARLRSAVLLSKPARRRVEFEPDYVGFTVDDRWIVGYGLDFEGLYRNLPHISYVE